MPHALAQAVEIVTMALAVAGMGYFLAVIVAARVFLHEQRMPRAEFAPGAPTDGSSSVGWGPGVSILKSLKGLDPGILDAFRSHCRQSYAGEFELLFGVASLDDPAATAVKELQAEFPDRAIGLVECPERLGTNGKVSTLAQLVTHAQNDFLLINDSDITVSPRYLERVMCRFAPASHDAGKPPVGLVTALYRGRAHNTLPSRLEALGIAAEFMPGVLLSKLIESGLHYGLGSTLAMQRETLEKAGGLLSIVDYLADDYELGARIAHAGYRVEVSAEVVETSVPAYSWRGFFDHQLRWLRTVRSARPGGYAGLIFTHGFGWAIVNVLASGLSPLSLWLLGLSFFLRLAQAMTVGAGVLGDHEVLANLWLLPLRDAIAMGLWVAGFAGDTIVWRGERFVLKDGKLARV
ncbi:MAG: bacteriohopanetetrol glucosamine biosynthesis glycosyltransferase HpnI [Terracidiphilus sp.]|jgi:ceramide glucosyltransferase